MAASTVNNATTVPPLQSDSQCNTDSQIDNQTHPQPNSENRTPPIMDADSDDDGDDTVTDSD